MRASTRDTPPTDPTFPCFATFSRPPKRRCPAYDFLPRSDRLPPALPPSLLPSGHLPSPSTPPQVLKHKALAEEAERRYSNLLAELTDLREEARTLEASLAAKVGDLSTATRGAHLGPVGSISSLT